MELSLWILGSTALLAGLVDAIAGGGGLLQLPALMLAAPNHPLPVLFGTNKFAAVWGTLAASVRYARRVELRWRLVAPAVVCAAVGAWSGARVVAWLNPSLLKPLVLVLLLGVALYTLLSPTLGVIHQPRLTPRAETLLAGGSAAVIGFYDGFLGPGTGSFLIFVFVRVLGHDFLNASALAKVVNVATNAAALGFFLPHGFVLWQVALVMALCNVTGAVIGSHLALQRGSQFVRRFFLVVVFVLIAKLAFELLQ